MIVSNLIPLIDEDVIQKAKALFGSFADSKRLESYRLPSANSSDNIVIGLSGGADSTVLAIFSAIYLSRHYPNIEYIFTDTKAEPDSAYATLDRLETILGISITRIVPKRGLFELIDHYNGFLPSSQKRWCTRELKVTPLLDYFKSKPDERWINLAGIRFDELDRDGIAFQHEMENGRSAYPLVDLKITKTAVFTILQEIVGIPSTYLYRSRSGCFSCFFQRNAEIIGLLFNDYPAFIQTEKREKLSADDQQRWHVLPAYESRLYPSYPVPAFVDIRKPDRMPTKHPGKLKVNQLPMEDMFRGTDPTPEFDDVFVAFALYVDPMLGLFGGREFTPGVYFQQFITVSTSLSGLKSALGTYYSYRKTTPMPQFDLKDLKIVIAQIRFPAGIVDTAPPGKGSFTWKGSVAYKQLRHIVSHCQAVLERADLIRRHREAAMLVREARHEDIVLDAIEQLESTENQLKALPDIAGDLVWEGLFSPSLATTQSVQLQLDGISQDSEIRPARENLEFDEVARACIACSI